MTSFFNFKKTILGLSNSEDKPTSGRRDTPSPDGLALISTTAAGIASPATVLESFAVNPTVPSATAATNSITIRTDDIQNSRGRAHFDRYATLTECVGDESCDPDPTATQFPSAALTAGVRRRETMRRRSEAVNNVLPPLISSLNENGRPRFDLKKVSKDGRLQIYKVQNDRPILRTSFSEEGRMKIQVVGSDREGRMKIRARF